MKGGVMSPDSGVDGAGHHRPATEITDAMRLQILSTEHWSLLASRSLAWNESFSRAGMFLGTVSGAIVALALAASFGGNFVGFALAVLPIVLYIGVATVVRLGESNYHDFRCVVGMNRIRSAYLTMAPDLARYFVMSPHDDLKGIMTTQGYHPDIRFPVRLLSATPALITTLTAAVAGVIGAILGELAGGVVWSVVGGLLAFGITFGALMLYARSMVRRIWSWQEPMFPTPDPD
jgi:hypothetical protein